MKSKCSPKLVRITTVPISLQKLISGQMKFMSKNGFEVYMISSPFNESTILEQNEESVFIGLDMTRTISPLKDLVALFKLTKLLRKLKPDIVHTHTPKAGILGMIASYLAKVPVRLHTVAGLPLMEADGFKRILLETVEKFTYLACTKVYPNSKSLAEFIINSKLCKPGKIKVLGNGSSNGINTESFKKNDDLMGKALLIKQDLNILPEDFVFIFIGRVVRDKGLHELIEAFKKISTNQPKVKLLLVGPTEPDLDPLDKECLREIHENRNILSVGYQADVRPYLVLSQALVFPSYREGFPNVPMQAGCFELPSIVSDINGCNEIIVDGKNGLIVPVKDSKALFEGMVRMLKENDLYFNMKTNARPMIVDRYEQRVIWDLMLQEYKDQLIRYEKL